MNNISVILAIAVLSVIAIFILILFAMAAVNNASEIMEGEHHENITKGNKPDC